MKNNTYKAVCRFEFWLGFVFLLKCLVCESCFKKRKHCKFGCKFECEFECVNLNANLNVNLNVNLELLCLWILFFKKESIKTSPTDASPYAYI